MFYAVGAEDHIEDTVLAVFLVLVAAVGVLGSLAAFVMALVSTTAKGERWNLLWIPLCTFPALAAFVLVWGALPGT